MDSEDFDWIVMAIRIQREVGGNLAEILHTVADTLREREYLRRQVKALSAEGRLSGYILVGAYHHSSGSYMMLRQPGLHRACSTRPSPDSSSSAWQGSYSAIGSFAMAKLAKVEV